MGAGESFPLAGRPNPEAVLMATITLPYRYLEQLVGTDHQTILSRLPMIGSDIERIEEDHADHKA